jgi:hypothetical protein
VPGPAQGARSDQRTRTSAFVTDAAARGSGRGRAPISAGLFPHHPSEAVDVLLADAPLDRVVVHRRCCGQRGFVAFSRFEGAFLPIDIAAISTGSVRRSWSARAIVAASSSGLGGGASMLVGPDLRHRPRPGDQAPLLHAHQRSRGASAGFNVQATILSQIGPRRARAAPAARRPHTPNTRRRAASYGG